MGNVSVHGRMVKQSSEERSAEFKLRNSKTCPMVNLQNSEKVPTMPHASYLLLTPYNAVFQNSEV